MSVDNTSQKRTRTLDGQESASHWSDESRVESRVGRVGQNSVNESLIKFIHPSLNQHLLDKLPFKIYSKLDNLNIIGNPSFGIRNGIIKEINWNGVKDTNPSDITIGNVRLQFILHNNTILPPAFIVKLQELSMLVLDTSKKIAKINERICHVENCINNSKGFGNINTINPDKTGLFGVSPDAKAAFVQQMEALNKKYIYDSNTLVRQALFDSLIWNLNEFYSDIGKLHSSHKEFFINIIKELSSSMVPINVFETFLFLTSKIKALFYDMISIEWDNLLNLTVAKISKKISFKDHVKEAEEKILDPKSSIPTISSLVKEIVSSQLESSGRKSPFPPKSPRQKTLPKQTAKKGVKTVIPAPPPKQDLRKKDPSKKTAPLEKRKNSKMKMKIAPPKIASQQSRRK